MNRVWSVPPIDFMSLREVEESRRVALIHSRPAWETIDTLLKLEVASELEATEATEEHWAKLSESVEGEVVYAIGGGLAMDAGKYVAWDRGLPLVAVPTALSVDAFLTWASGHRESGSVSYMETKPPDKLVIDFDVIKQAPRHLRAAGICDVLSIATGCADWELADARNKNPKNMKLIPYAVETARGILRGALDCAEAAGKGDPGGLRQLLECLALEVQLCNLLGHSRPEEGSEHYFAYAVENRLGKGLPHGDLVGPGVVLMARAQGQDPAPLRAALEAAGVRLRRIDIETIQAAWLELPAYCAKHGLPYGVAHELKKHSVDGALNALGLI